MGTVRIQGMRCQHCAATVEKIMESCGAHRVQVDLAQHVVCFEGSVDREALRTALAAKGFVLAE